MCCLLGEHICQLIVAACVCHNLCIICDDAAADFFDEDIADNAVMNNYPPVFPNAAAGVNKRNQLVQYLQQFMR